MRKWFSIVLVIVSVALIGWLGWKVLRSPEPSFQGRRLSQWLDEYNRAGDMGKTEPVSEAICAMGTNTLPFLLANIKHTDSPLAQKFFSLLRKQHLVKLPFWAEARKWNPYRSTSILAVSALGSNAAPLCPELLKVSEDYPTSYRLGSMSLLAIGPASLPTLAKVCQNTNEAVRAEAAVTIAKLKTDTRPWFAWNWENDPVSGRRIFVISYSTQTEPYSEVREIVSLLEDPDAAIRRACADALGHYIGLERSEVAESAMEALVKALSDPDADVRLAAGHALKVIDPIAAARVGVK